MIEIEKTFLVKKLPGDLEKVKPTEITDIYFPADARHPTLRLRKSGSNCELTKKTPVDKGDASRQRETSVRLSLPEWRDLASAKQGRQLRKFRYRYPYNQETWEIDIFTDKLKGLVLADIEITSDSKSWAEIQIPKFCLAEVTQSEFIAGGMLAGKSYQDIAKKLEKYKYNPILI